ncbi:putative quinol monooxygenase [Bibersteinia trehalosi]|uniref:putative quinol monooxygenase n=1 Tax=Bibersteinia trehalosi TaxID=47735 RepID=UPI0009DE9D2A
MLKNQPNEWRFFEIYADENAYAAHRASEHFQHYLSATAEMVAEKKLISLQGGTLMNKGGMQFVAK